MRLSCLMRAPIWRRVCGSVLYLLTLHTLHGAAKATHCKKQNVLCVIPTESHPIKTPNRKLC